MKRDAPVPIMLPLPVIMILIYLTMFMLQKLLWFNPLMLQIDVAIGVVASVWDYKNTTI